MSWYNINWNYRKSITISNTGSALTDYQVPITIDTSSLVSASKLLSSCNDIRFTSSDGSTLLNYWIESGCNTSSTKIWVKIPSISTGSNAIYLYYGNATPPNDGYGSNGTNTFMNFGFDGYTKVDPNSHYTITSNKIDVVGVTNEVAYVYKNIQSTSDFIYNLEYYRATGVSPYGVQAPIILGDGFGRLTGAAWGTKNGVGILSNSNPHTFYISKWVSGTITSGTSIAYSENTPYYITLKRAGTTLTLSVYSNAARTTHITGSPQTLTVASTAFNYLNFAVNADYNYARSYYEQNFYARKYASPEPSACVGGEEIQTPSWLSGWDKRKAITISGSISGAQTDFQMKLTVHKATGTDTPTDIYLGTNVNNDFSDLRFTSQDGSNNLNYWIESYTSGSVATVWIKIPSIPANPCTTTIYIYYNNTGATTTSDGTNTFIQYTDFSSSTGWSLGTGWAISGNLLSFTGSSNSPSYSTTAVTQNQYSVVSRLRGTTANFRIFMGAESNSPFTGATETGSALYSYGTYVNKLLRYNNGTPYATGAVSFTTVQNTWYILEIIIDDVTVNYISKAYTDDRTITATTSYSTKGSGTGNTFGFLAPAYEYQDIDWIFVRKYTSPEPTFLLIGTEEISGGCGTPSANLIVLEIVSNQLLRQYPSYLDIDAISKLIDNYR